MYIQHIKNIEFIKNLSNADIARLAGVSRAAVTKWFREAEKKSWVNVETKTLIRLAEGLGISPDYLLRPRENLSRWQTPFLWDGLYPSMESFVAAIGQNRLPALARLVQVLGFREAVCVVGQSAITEFHQYKKYIKPARRKQLESLWPLYASPN